MWRDEHTGLYHTHYRLYDPQHVRWLTPDPAGYRDGQNLYRFYAGPNGVDVLGLEDFETIEEIEEASLEIVYSHREIWIANERSKLENKYKKIQDNGPGVVVETAKSVVNYDLIGDSYHLIRQTDCTFYGIGNCFIGVIGVTVGVLDTAFNFISLGAKPPVQKSATVVGKELLISQGEKIAAKEILDATVKSEVKNVAETIIQKEVIEGTGTFIRTSVGEVVGELADPLKVERIFANLEKQGVTIVKGVDAEPILKIIGGNAGYSSELGGPTLFFSKNITRGQLIEELLHYGQDFKRKFIGPIDSHNIIKLGILDEIEAQNYLINHAIKHKWTTEEIDFYKNQLSIWTKKLEELEKKAR